MQEGGCRRQAQQGAEGEAAGRGSSAAGGAAPDGKAAQEAGSGGALLLLLLCMLAWQGFYMWLYGSLTRTIRAF
jgi:hypothetical protein